MTSENSIKQKLLKFALAEDFFLLSGEVISEILRYQPITKVPTIPKVVHGVLNLRGKYIPVIDLAKRLVPENESIITDKTCIVITECQGKEETLTLGLIVDEVSDFLEIKNDEISEPPKFGHSIAAELIKGMIRIETIDYLILDVEKLLDLDQLIALLESLKDEPQEATA